MWSAIHVQVIKRHLSQRFEAWHHFIHRVAAEFFEEGIRQHKRSHRLQNRDRTWDRTEIRAFIFGGRFDTAGEVNSLLWRQGGCDGFHCSTNYDWLTVRYATFGAAGAIC